MKTSGAVTARVYPPAAALSIYTALVSATVPFLEKLLQVLDQGGFSSTYKYAVLLALIDLCLEAGHPPTSVTTTQLARRVVELYWPQVRPFADGAQDPSGAGEGRVLRQNSGPKEAKIVQLLSAFQTKHGATGAPPRCHDAAPAEVRALYLEVEWVLVEYPLPRLQKVGGEEERFLYQISWGEGVSGKAFLASKRGDNPLYNAQAFDNTIRFVHGASAQLIALSAVLRPLIQQGWLAKVRKINHMEEAELERAFFGAERSQLRRLKEPLAQLQRGDCFYCQGPLCAAPQVDHFLPWSRYPDDGLDNLVLAHQRCNRQKLHFLADLDFAQRWARRSREQERALTEIARAADWPQDRSRTFGVVAGIYQGVPEGVRLWAGGDSFRRVEPDHLPAVHGFGRALLSG